MRITIDSNDGSTVRFRAEVGSAVAMWKGPPPLIGQCADVEVDIECALDAVNTQIVNANAEASIGGDGSTVVIVARVEYVWDDGMLDLRLSASCTIMAECLVTLFGIGDLVRIRIPASALTITPCGA